MSTGPRPHAPSASEPLRRFLQVARGAGLRVSAAEGIDAARALELIGLADRTLVRDTLGLVIAKTPDEKALYEETFDLYFRRDLVTPASEGEERVDARSPSAESAAAPAAGAQTSSADPAMPSLAALLDGDDRAALAAAVEAAARAVGLDQIRYFTQKNLFVRRILDAIGLRAVELEVEALTADGAPPALERAAFLERRIEALRESVRDLVERAMLLNARGEMERFREELLKSTRLANVERRDLDRMRLLVRQMAKRLATRFARTRRRQQRGQLDVRRTLARNMGWGGVPFVTAWKEKRIEKPSLVVLCDVSGSVAPMAQFLLMFLYALTEALSDIRSFAFTNTTMEVSALLEREPVEQAIERIMSTIGFGSSAYGAALADFADEFIDCVGPRSTVIVLGDARGNRTDPRTDVLAGIANRARRVLWLNPEPRTSWGTGDSDMFRYAPYCSLVRVCSTLRHLERVVTDLLELSD